MNDKEKKNLLELGIAAAIILGVSAWCKWMSHKEETVVVIEEPDNRRCPMCALLSQICLCTHGLIKREQV